MKHPELYLFFKDGVVAMNERKKQVERGRKKMQEKRIKTPNRYRCAAVGCGVEADSGKMLSQCQLFFLFFFEMAVFVDI